MWIVAKFRHYLSFPAIPLAFEGVWFGMTTEEHLLPYTCWTSQAYQCTRAVEVVSSSNCTLPLYACHVSLACIANCLVSTVVYCGTPWGDKNWGCSITMRGSHVPPLPPTPQKSCTKLHKKQWKLQNCPNIAICMAIFLAPFFQLCLAKTLFSLFEGVVFCTHAPYPQNTPPP